MPLRITLNVSTLAALGVALLLTLGGTAMIRANAKTQLAAERVPLPVAVTRFTPNDGFWRDSQHLGVVTAASDSAVGFEVAGQLQSLAVAEGYRVRRGDVLAVLDTARREAQLANARSRLAQVESDIALAEKRTERISRLAAQGLASQQTLDEALLGEQSLRAASDAARATVREAELQIEQSTLRAPYDAIVVERLLQPGAALGAGSPVLRLIAATAREAHIGIPVAAASALRIGDTYSLGIGDQTFEAPLGHLRDDLDPATLTLGAVFPVPAGVRASVGEPAQLTLAQHVPIRGGWLPLTALIEGQRGLWTVLTVADASTTGVTRRESVEVIYVEGDRAFVRGSLAEGAAVIATGLQRISPGAVIDPQLALSTKPTAGLK